MPPRPKAGFRLAGLGACVTLTACQAGSDLVGPPLGCHEAPLMYDNDDRRPLTPGDDWFERGRHSVVALVGPRLADMPNPPDAGPPDSVGRTQGLCPDEPDYALPALANCSGVLLNDEILLTAGHCLRGATPCSAYTFLTGYTYDPDGGFGWDRAPRTHHCSEVLWRNLGDPTERAQLDFALVRLSEPVSTTTAVQPRLPELGEPVVFMSYPAGAPLTIDRGGQVLTAYTDNGAAFGVDVDAFGGSSGGPVFGNDGGFLGIVTQGMQDYELDADAQCFRSVRRSADVDAGVFERALRSDVIWAAACDAGVRIGCDLLDTMSRSTSAPKNDSQSPCDATPAR